MDREIVENKQKTFKFLCRLVNVYALYGLAKIFLRVFGLCKKLCFEPTVIDCVLPIVVWIWFMFFLKPMILKSLAMEKAAAEGECTNV